MRQTQTEQIKAAARAYIIALNRDWTRFQVYLDAGDGLAVLWPSDADPDRKSRELLPGQTYSRRQNLPAYHWHLTGYGYSKTNEITETLHRINPEIIVEVLAGASPYRA